MIGNTFIELEDVEPEKYTMKGAKKDVEKRRKSAARKMGLTMKYSKYSSKK